MTQAASGPASPEEIQALAAGGLYDPANEHDACGVGFVAHIKGQKAHSIVEQGLKILENLDHRGAVGADALMGDGAGILIQIPDEFFRAEMADLGVELPPPGEYGVGMIFLPKEHASRLACEQEVERAIRAEGQVLLGWRDVPVDQAMPMSPTVRKTEPVIRQVFIGRGADVIVPDALERKLYVIRKTCLQRRSGSSSSTHRRRGILVRARACPTSTHGLQRHAADRTSSTSTTSRTCRTLAALETALALVHSTLLHQHLPRVAARPPLPHGRAQRRDQHRASGNINWMRAREGVLKSPVLFGDDIHKLYPIDQLRTAVRLRRPSTTRSSCSVHERLRSLAARDDDDDPGSPGNSMSHMDRARKRRSTSTTPPDGALGRSGVRWSSPTASRSAPRWTAMACVRRATYVTDDDLVVMASEAGVLPMIPREQASRSAACSRARCSSIDFELRPHRRRRGAQEPVVANGQALPRSGSSKNVRSSSDIADACPLRPICLSA